MSGGYPAVLLLIALVGLGCRGSDGASPADLGSRRNSVGYRVIDLPYPAGPKGDTLTLAVWYPTTAEPSPLHYGGRVHGHVAVDGAVDTEHGPYPLLLYSHGYGGCALAAAFFTEALAGQGWIAVAPDHHDKQSAVRTRTGAQEGWDRRAFVRDAKRITESGPEDRAAYLYRLDEMRLALDGILASEPFGAIIDTGRIAVGGHSLGGFTALGVAGTIPEYQDERVRAILLFSTGA
ncbi:MAG: hypothetical protein JXR94_04130, partial [Candidatus Hydrogenedentes bacterium]|nr:hypothetical protein [Candidatus Hydrogenedentota bacterium]